MKERYERSYKSLQKKEEELDSLIKNATANDSNSKELAKKIDNLNSILGLSKLEGPGLIIRVKDGEIQPNSIVPPSNYIIHDEDLRMIVSYLFNAGAEAVSINGERIVSNTAITCIGSTIKINDEKITNPFTIKAIGKTKLLLGSMQMQGGYLYNLEKDWGISVEYEESDSVTIEAYDGIYKYEYATKAE